MVANFRKDLGMPDLKFFCGELSDGRPEFDGFNLNVIQQVQTYIPNSDYVMATGTILLADGIHWDEPSVLMMGERYADKFLQDVYDISTSVEGTKAIKLSFFIVNSHLKILNSNNDSEIRLYDMLGKSLSQFELKSGESKELSLKKGAYLLSLTRDKFSEIYKVIVP
jgi:hypothetical protein